MSFCTHRRSTVQTSIQDAPANQSRNATKRTPLWLPRGSTSFRITPSRSTNCPFFALAACCLRLLILPSQLYTSPEPELVLLRRPVSRQDSFNINENDGFSKDPRPFRANTPTDAQNAQVRRELTAGHRASSIRKCPTMQPWIGKQSS